MQVVEKTRNIILVTLDRFQLIEIVRRLLQQLFSHLPAAPGLLR